MVGGFFYNETNQNIARIFFPNGNVYEQYKLELSPIEKSQLSAMDVSNQSSKDINIFKSSIGDFAVLICYDFTNPALIDLLRGKIDYLIIPSWNNSVKTYAESAAANCYSNYCHIVICNVADYGGSCIYAPMAGEKKLLYIEKGTHRGVFDVDLDLFRLACCNYKEYEKRLPHYKDRPSEYIRSCNFDLQLKDISNTWDASRDNFVEHSRKALSQGRSSKKELIKIIDIMESCMQNEGYIIPNSLLLQLQYLAVLMNEGINAIEHFNRLDHFSMTGGDKIKDASEQEYRFMPKEKFLNDFKLKWLEDKIERHKSDMVECWREICSEKFRYPENAYNFNVVSMWPFPDQANLMLITRSAALSISPGARLDKRNLTTKDIVLVYRETKKEDAEHFKDRYRYNYTSDSDENIRPSQEAPLNYEIHQALNNEVILHVHPENILERAWIIPRAYGGENKQNVLTNNYSVPSIKGRQIRFDEISKSMINIFKKNQNIDAIIGTRHGIWIKSNEFKNALEKMAQIEDEAKNLAEKAPLIDPIEILKEIRKELAG